MLTFVKKIQENSTNSMSRDFRDLFLHFFFSCTSLEYNTWSFCEIIYLNYAADDIPSPLPFPPLTEGKGQKNTTPRPGCILRSRKYTFALVSDIYFKIFISDLHESFFLILCFSLQC